MVNCNLKFPTNVILGAMFSTLLVTSCGSRMVTEGGNMSQSAPPAASSAAKLAPLDTLQDTTLTATSIESQNRIAMEPYAANAKNLANRPQLAKIASLGLSVESVTDALKQARIIIDQQQSDLLGLQDSPAPQTGGRHTLSLQMRVPQERLDATVEALSKLGTVQTRGLSAEDVSDQLVDFDARLRNLRKTESTLLTIMDRSGSVGDVLKVAQELSRVRDETERIAAQLANLRSRVAFSQLSVTLEEVIASQQPQRPFGAEFSEAWDQSTHSVVSLTMKLGQLGIWLVAYTPYWLVLGVLVWAWKTRSLPWQRRMQLTPQPNLPTDQGNPSD